MGDDLIFAQKFTRTAADGLSLIVEMEDPRAAGDSAVVIDMMTTLQRGAKRLRARHIYSGAQGVLAALHHDTDAVLHNRIESLGSLVTEYARGLDELLDKPDLSHAKSHEDTWHAARETLNSLLPIAASGDADMLSRLMRAPITPEILQSETRTAASGSDVVHFLQTDTFRESKTSETTSEKKERVSAAPAQISSPVSSDDMPTDDIPRVSIALDAMMRDVVADALSVARSVGRTISLSYDMGDKTVTDSQAENLQSRLGQALSQIIRESLTDDKVGHIDVNLAGEQLHILAGTTAMRVAIIPQAVSETQPQAKRLITPETEPGLRDQLNALMDPIAFHETAS